jgi:hypothetical protein
MDEAVAFCAHTFGGTVFISGDGEIIYSLPTLAPRGTSAGVALKESILGGTIQDLRGLGQAGARISDFRGQDPTRWKASLPTYETIDLGQVYEGIHLTLRAYGNNVEKLFYVEPGADPGRIQMQIQGADVLEVADSGELVARTALGPVTFTRPLAYQEAVESTEPVAVAYSVCGDVYGFALGDYDLTQGLYIDPLLASTFVGGSDGDGLGETPVAKDSQGNIYVAGRTLSWDFPTTVGAYDTSLSVGRTDVFVSKLDPDLETLLASTYLGGSHHDGLWPGVAMVLDGDDNVIVAARTRSTDFPHTPGAFDSTFGGSGDFFVSKLSSDLETLLASTYLGGMGVEDYALLAADTEGNIYVTGATQSIDFPYTSGTFDTTVSIGNRDMFVCKFDGQLTTLLAGTFLGGTGLDVAEVFLLDLEGNVTLTGWTSSGNFPTSPGAYDDEHGGGYYDAFVTKLNPDLTTLVASTFLGGEDWDFGYAMTIDGDGYVYIGGHTASDLHFPYSPGAYDTLYNGAGIPGTDDDAFVSKFDPDLTSLLASTYLGGHGWECTEGMAADGNGNLYVSGTTSSPDFPVPVEGAFDDSYGGSSNINCGDVFIARLDVNLTRLMASTYLGGSDVDNSGGLMSEPGGTVLVSGSTASLDFPWAAGGYDPSHNGGLSIYSDRVWGGDAFIARMDSLLSSALTSVPDSDRSSAGRMLRVYPNPFNPRATIEFAIPHPGHVRLAVYDVKGQRVRTLVDGEIGAGIHLAVWDGRDFVQARVGSGIYFARLEFGERIEHRKMVLLK